MEISVSNHFGLGDIVAHVIHVSQIGFQLGAVDGEGVDVINLERAIFKSSLDFGNLFSGAGSSSLFIEFRQFHRACSDGAGPVGSNGFAIHHTVDHVFEVGFPVDAGRNDEGVGAGRHGGTIVGNGNW